MSNPEIHTIAFRGVQFRLHLTHEDADHLLASAGWRIPEIPAGCNTVTFFFELPDGLHALAVNQRGFAPEVRDDEREVNGCQIIICLHRSLDLIDARKLLQEFHQELQKPDSE